MGQKISRGDVLSACPTDRPFHVREIQDILGTTYPRVYSHLACALQHGEVRRIAPATFVRTASAKTTILTDSPLDRLKDGYLALKSAERSFLALAMQIALEEVSK